jgi:hypothetical protein
MDSNKISSRPPKMRVLNKWPLGRLWTRRDQVGKDTKQSKESINTDISGEFMGV